MKNFKSHTIKLYPDQSKTYFNASQAIEDMGFEYFETYENWNPVNGKTFRKVVFERLSDSRLFVFAGMDHYNTTIYHIKLRELTDAGARGLRQSQKCENEV